MCVIIQICPLTRITVYNQYIVISKMYTNLLSKHSKGDVAPENWILLPIFAGAWLGMILHAWLSLDTPRKYM